MGLLAELLFTPPQEQNSKANPQVTIRRRRMGSLQLVFDKLFPGALSAGGGRWDALQCSSSGFRLLVGGHGRQFHPVARTGLAEDTLQVPLHGVLADFQFGGDLAVA